MSARFAVPTARPDFPLNKLAYAVALAMFVAVAPAAHGAGIDGQDAAYGVTAGAAGGSGDGGGIGTNGAANGGAGGTVGVSGGKGGNGRNSAGGNATPAAPSAPGGSNDTTTGGYGGAGGYASATSGGGGGGGGGAIAVQYGTDQTVSSNISGGRGGNGGNGAFNGAAADSGAGGGGGGGMAIRSVGGNLTIDATVRGGAGGNGGAGVYNTTGAAGGGVGGDGLWSSASGQTVTVNATGAIIGGAGGDGGKASTLVPFPAGRGGNGGTGLIISNATIINIGTIAGGNGGAGGQDPTSPANATNGNGSGGQAIQGANLNIINAGTIAAGRSGDGLTRDVAITLYTASSRLELQAGSTTEGKVIGSGATLALGGSGNQTFDMSGVGDTYATAQFYNFGKFEKTGAGTATLTGAVTATTPWTLRDGTLSINNDALLGDTAGDLTFDGGKLAITGTSQATDRNVHFLSSGEVSVDNAATDVVWNGTVDGAAGAALIKSGAGSLTLLGANSFDGAQVKQGTLIGNTGSLIGDISVDAPATVRFDQDVDGTYANRFSGAGTVAKSGTGTLTLTGDSSPYSGTAQVNQGTLNVLGKLGGSVIVAQNAVLAGTGTVGNTTVDAGGTLSPGDAATGAPGVLKVNGNLTLASGSTLQIRSDVATQQASKVEVSGSANVAGTLASVAANGDYSTAVPYTVLSAGSGVTGNFDRVSSNLAFLDAKIANTGNALVMTLQRKDVPTDPTPPTDGGTPPITGGDTPPAGGGTGGSRPMTFADAAASRNQRAVANAVESLGSGNALYRQVENLAEGQPQSVFKALSGEAYASTASTLRMGADTARVLPLEHFRANLNANLLAGAPTAQAGTSDLPTNLSALPTSSAKPVWAQVFGTWQTFGGGNDAARVTQSTTGLFVGGDTAVGGGWRAGGALGYSETRSRAGEVSSKADIDNYSATLYGGRSFAAGPGKLNFLAGASYTWHDIDSRRSIDAGGFDQSLRAKYGASTSQLFTELGYALPVTPSFTLEPFAGLAWSDMRTRGFSESGGSAALSGAGERNTLTTTTLGLRSSTAFALGRLDGKVGATLGWRHAFGAVTTHSKLWFDGSDTFTVAGVPQARDSALVTLSADVAVTRNMTLGLAYGGEFGGGNTQNSGMLNAAWKF